MRKIITLGFTLLLVISFAALSQINRKTVQLRKEKNGIEYRIMELKSSQESVEKAANLTIVRTAGPKQAITL